MAKRYEKALSAEELAALPDSEIDTSDIPERGNDFWQNARLVLPDKRQSVTLRVRSSVIEAFKAGGKGYQTRMNAVLESYAKAMLSKR
jgi:uncharacterized protein (DUF4415 family)